MSIFNSSRVLGYIAILVCAALIFGWAIKANRVPDTRLETFYQRASSIELVTLGTSHSVGFHFPTLAVEGYSFYGNGMDVEASLLKLKLIVPHTPELRCVVLPSTLGFTDYDVPNRHAWLAYTPKITWKTDLEFSKIKEILYAKLVSLEVVHSWITASETVKSKISRYLSSPKTTFENDACVLPSRADFPDQDGIRHGYFPSGFLTDHCTQKLAEQTARSHRESLPQTRKDTQAIRMQNFEYLHTMSKIMEQRGGYLYLITPPTTNAYRRAMGLEATDYSEFIQQELGQMSNIRIHDFSELFSTKSTEDQSQLFFDDDHLSVQGAAEFSKQLSTVLQGPCQTE